MYMVKPANTYPFQLASSTYQEGRFIDCLSTHNDDMSNRLTQVKMIMEVDWCLVFRLIDVNFVQFIKYITTHIYHETTNKPSWFIDVFPTLLWLHQWVI